MLWGPLSMHMHWDNKRFFKYLKPSVHETTVFRSPRSRRMHRRGNVRRVWLGSRQPGYGVAHEPVNKDEKGLRSESVVWEDSVANLTEGTLMRSINLPQNNNNYRPQLRKPIRDIHCNCIWKFSIPQYNCSSLLKTVTSVLFRILPFCNAPLWHMRYIVMQCVNDATWPTSIWGH